MKTKLIIIGGGGHSRSCLDVIKSKSEYRVIGYTDLKKDNKINLKYLGKDKDLISKKKICNNLIIGIGQIKSPNIRIKLISMFQKENYKFPIIISSRAYVSSNSIIDDGTIVMHDALVNSNTKIGKFSIINTKCLIEHDSKIGNYSHISTGVIINGNCTIGNKTFIGSGSIINENIKIGNNCVIKSGSRISKEIPDNTFI